MPARAQGVLSQGWCRGPAAAVACCAVFLCGCAGGMDLDRMAADRSIVTGSVKPANDPVAADAAAIRMAVAEWAPGQPPPKLIPWVNVRTGSSGAIESIADDTSAANGDCRIFKATREAFDGVGLFRGRACSADGGPWRVHTLEKD